jgi:very-short-patch-repair endonuclease
MLLGGSFKTADRPRILPRPLGEGRGEGRLYAGFSARKSMRPHPDKPTPAKIRRAKTLRANSTFPERLLWSRLRGARLCGLKFRRQHSIDGYTADFYCHEQSLVIELDGNSHEGRAEHDLKRTGILQQRSLRVIRFGNDDVLHDLDAVLMVILRECGIDPNVKQPSPQPSPRGRGSRLAAN